MLELLVLAGRPIEEAVSMLIPEPWSGHESMADDLKAVSEANLRERRKEASAAEHILLAREGERQGRQDRHHVR